MRLPEGAGNQTIPRLTISMLFYASVGVKMALLREALRGLLHDGIPQSSSHHVTTSRKAAEELLDWTAAEANADRSESFTSKVVQLLDKAFPTTQLGRT